MTPPADRQGADLPPPPQMPPPGWYANPEGLGLRWWDGAHWTQYRHQEVTDRADESAPADEQPQPATASTRKGARPGNQGLGGALVVVVIALLIAHPWHSGSSSQEASSSASRSSAPVNSEGGAVRGPVPAPDSDPCWEQTERAVEISPDDGGQSAMPQRCIEMGF